MQIYVHRNNQQLGPFTEDQIRSQLAAGTIKLQDHAWWEGQTGWVPLAQTPFASAPVPGAVVVPPGLPGPAAPHLNVPSGSGMSSLAMASLVCGIISFFCCCPSVLTCAVGIFLPSLAAVILGHLALVEIKKNPAIEGRGLALAGLVLGYIFTALGVIYLLIAIGYFMMGTKNEFLDQLQRELRPAPAIVSPAPAKTPDNDDNDSTNSSDTNAPPNITP